MVSAMRNATISIGRNVGSTPMHTDDWNSFRLDILSVLPTAPIFCGSGLGFYEGVKEESFTVIVDAERVDLDYLRACLQAFACQYGQECIALTVGEPELVAPQRNAVSRAS